MELLPIGDLPGVITGVISAPDEPQFIYILSQRGIVTKYNIVDKKSEG